MTDDKQEVTGLTAAEVRRRQQRYGKNELIAQKKEGFFRKALPILCEPMFLLLMATAVIYFILGEPGDGAVMLVFVAGIIGIDVMQGWKTDRTLRALKDLSAPQVTVIRDGRQAVVASADLVPGDIMMIHEGVKVPADGVVVRCSDLCVDESSLTGEAEGVWKTSGENAERLSDYLRKDDCYAGTLVIQGTGVIRVEKTGAATEYGKIGAHVAAAPAEPTPLQKQMAQLVKTCAGIAGVLLALTGVATYLNLPEYALPARLTESVLSGITLAMAMIPEEFPVILTVFLSMGAWRLGKKRSLVRKLPSVETLGEVSVLCVDKTGTITRNRMTVREVWAPDGDERALIETMGLGCETDAYDPMEKAMLTFCGANGISREELFRGDLIREYAFTDRLKMMGHVWRRDGRILVAAKGSPERILTICDMTDREREANNCKITALSLEGLRVIAVASTVLSDETDVPVEITGCRLQFRGLIGLFDPPRESMRRDIAACRRAGIRVVMITGDNGITASSIAKKIGMENCGRIITGDMLSGMSDDELRKAVKNASIFSRVAPEHKMQIVKAFRENGKIVAMTGDGVNDAPALKYADIGIAMGRRGSEVSREAADLVLLDDNFTTIVETVKDGRRIYDNIRKAVGYIVTIHIPIALASLLAPVLGVPPSALPLLPLHVVLLELLIDPTCSIVLERQPAETDVMTRPPRDPKEKLLGVKTLIKSVVQGLVLFASSFGAYFFSLVNSPANVPEARAMGLVILMLSNLFLVQVNSSDRDSVFCSMTRLFKDRVMWISNLGTLLMVTAILYTPLSGFLKLAPLSAGELFRAAGIAAAAVFWYEPIKLYRKFR
ncbi:MAG: cation-translocating P-type ATPase [Intestinimonas sp.]|jgi:Ca2+-transporting ATPase|nr:cation-translocating P-type ATPase [Intestinimonas sp.]